MTYEGVPSINYLYPSISALRPECRDCTTALRICARLRIATRALRKGYDERRDHVPREAPGCWISREGDWELRKEDPTYLALAEEWADTRETMSGMIQLCPGPANTQGENDTVALGCGFTPEVAAQPLIRKSPLLPPGAPWVGEAGRRPSSPYTIPPESLR